MSHKLRTPSGIPQILASHANQTVDLAASVGQAEAVFRRNNHHMANLLADIGEELRAVVRGIHARHNGSISIDPSRYSRAAQLEPASLENDSMACLGTLIADFCRYAKATSHHVVAAAKENDHDTVVLLDRILRFAHKSVWFLDIYGNAIGLRCDLSRLPPWTRQALQRTAG